MKKAIMQSTGGHLGLELHEQSYVKRYASYTIPILSPVFFIPLVYF